MKCATNMLIVLALFVAAALHVASSGAACASIHDGAATALDGDGVSATGPITATEPVGAEVSLHSPESPLISEEDIQDTRKWEIAIQSNDPTMLDSILRHCKNHGSAYVYEAREALKVAHWERRWESLSKIIRVLLEMSDRIGPRIPSMITDAIESPYSLYLAAILKGMAEKMNWLPETIGRVLATIVIVGSKDYPGGAEEIYEHATHAGLKRLSEIAMIENQEERLDALAACLIHRRDWPDGLIERIAEIIYDKNEYRILKLLLDMEPSNKDDLRRRSVYELSKKIPLLNIGKVSELIQIFDISAANVHNALKEAVSKYIDYGSTDGLENIIDLLDSNPTDYKLAVDAALTGFTREKTVNFSRRCQQNYETFQDWLIIERGVSSKG